MTPSLRLLTSRLLLALMLQTFLSPSFGWQMVAGHETPDHGKAAVNHHGLHAGQPVLHEHEHEDAHTMAGHVLSHMSAIPFSAVLPPARPYQPVLQAAEPLLAIPSLPPDQPYRPPQTLFV